MSASVKLVEKLEEWKTSVPGSIGLASFLKRMT
jgi:hypothetical protein